MMNILVFRTANNNRMKEVLKMMDCTRHQVTIVLPVHLRDSFQRQYPQIHCITTDQDHMDYVTLRRENKIFDTMYDEVWIPSSFKNNYYAFGEVYAALDDMKYRKMIWIDADDQKMIQYRSIRKKALDRVCFFPIWFIFEASKIMNAVETKLLGYRW